MKRRIAKKKTCNRCCRTASRHFPWGLVHAQSHPFDAVIMDLIVPGGMGGKEAIQKFLAVDPQAKVIVSSGYCYDRVMADFENYGFIGVIAKPYLLAELSEQMHKLHMEDEYE